MNALRILCHLLTCGKNQWVLKDVSYDDASELLSDNLKKNNCVTRESQTRPSSDTVIKAELKAYMETIQASENIHVLYFVSFDLLYYYAQGQHIKRVLLVKKL